MMKKILAVAIVSAFAAPAFAATANVDIYGTLNMSVDRVDGDGTASSRTRVSSNNSNFGLKGSEDLGGGLSAVWQFEQAIAVDVSGGSFATRNSFAGLSSKTLGALTLGNQESPMKTSIGSLDMFGNTIADYRTLIGPQVRGANSILYSSPNMSGLSAKLMYAARDEDGLNDNRDYWSGNVTYANGPIFGAIAHERTNTSAVAGQDTTRVGFGYSFGDAKIGLGYNKTEQDLTATTDVKSSSWLLSGAYKMGNITLKGQYVKANDTKGTNGAANTGANQWAVGADYALSKRTGLYALYTKLNNDSASARTLGNNGGVLGANTGVDPVAAGGLGADPTAFSVGMIHKF